MATSGRMPPIPLRRCARQNTGRRWRGSTMSTAIATCSADAPRWPRQTTPEKIRRLTLTSLNRWKASALHLALSAAIGATVIMLMLAIWYPQHYFAAMGSATLILLLIGVDVVVGPLI